MPAESRRSWNTVGTTGGNTAPTSTEAMRLPTQRAPFEPGPLGQGEPAPQWEAFAPRPPGGLARLFGGENRRRKAEQLAHQQYEQALATHQQGEQERMSELQRLEQQHERTEDQRLRHVAEHNRGIDQLERDFHGGAQEAVEKFLKQFLQSEELPNDVPDDVEVGYRPDAIQAKRYKKLVPAEASRALWGVMEDKKAGTGVLVATSYFGQTTHDFVASNERMRLIEGPELKHLLKEYLDLDVVLGAAPPPNRKDD